MKRGISPLIATVLVIGFTIAVAGITFTFIRGEVKEQTESTDISGVVNCLNAEVKIVNICIPAQNQLRISVDNEGETTITGLKYRVLGSTSAAVVDSQSVTSTQPKQQFERVIEVITHNDVGNLEEVIVLPVTPSGVCSSGEDSEKNIQPC